MKRHNTEWEDAIGENIIYRSGSPLMAVLNLAIDDGVPSRGHRTNIFKDNFYFTGVGTEAHKSYQSETVATYSGSYLLAFAESYVSPDIDVPKSIDDYTQFAAWDWPSKCIDPFAKEAKKEEKKKEEVKKEQEAEVEDDGWKDTGVLGVKINDDGILKLPGCPHSEQGTGRFEDYRGCQNVS